MPSRTTPAWAASGFAAGTFVQTTRGLRPVERLVPGEDIIEARDGTAAPLLAMHRARYTESALKRTKGPRPILVDALALGGTVPTRPLLVAPNVHVMAQGRLVNRVTQSNEMLLPFEALTGYDGVKQVIPPGGVTYFHPVCAVHCVLRVEGLISETLFVGAGADAKLRDAQPAECHSMTTALPRADAGTAGRLSQKLQRKNRPLAAEEEEK